MSSWAAQAIAAPTLLVQMRAKRNDNAAFDMSFFDIFVHGLTTGASVTP